MKTYICNVCKNRCLLVHMDDNSRPPRGCSNNQECNASWEQIENRNIDCVYASMEQLRGRCDMLSKINEELKNKNDKLRRRFESLKDWIAALLTLGTSGLENITGGKADEE